MLIRLPKYKFYLPDTRQQSRATPARSSDWYSPAELRDTCPLKTRDSLLQNTECDLQQLVTD